MKKISSEDIKNFIDIFAGIVLLLGFGFFTYLTFNIFKLKLDNLLNYLGISGLYTTWIIITYLLIVFLIAKYYLKEKFLFFHRINGYTVVSIYFIALSIGTSISVAQSLIPADNLLINRELKSTYGGSNITLGYFNCYSEDFETFVKNDLLICRLQAEIPSDIIIANNTRLFRFKIQQYDGNTLLPISKYGDYTLNIYKEKYDDSSIYIQLPDINYAWIKYEITTTNETLFAKGSQTILLKDALTAVEENQQRKGLIYSLLILSLSFSIFAIFGGINSFRQLVQNRP